MDARLTMLNYLKVILMVLGLERRCNLLNAVLDEFKSIVYSVVQVVV